MYGLYSAYGGMLSRCYWWLFRRYSLIRWFTRIEESSLPFPYNEIREADATDAVMAFNMGSVGVERKISILGYDNGDHAPFFAKYAQSDRARLLVLHEADVYKLLASTQLTPRLTKLIETTSGVFLRAEYIHGTRPANMLLNGYVVKTAVVLSKYHFDSSVGAVNGLQTCLSHGDFCPWNFLQDGDNWRLVDWELAGERTLGYDLLTYICNVSALFCSQKPLTEAIAENKQWLDEYFSHFNISDYRRYITAFAQEKAEYETGKNNMALAGPYKKLFESL